MRTASVAAALVAVGFLARAQSATTVLVACPGLAPAQVDELGARARLIIQSSGTLPRPQRVQLDCTRDGIHLFVDGNEAGPIDMQRGLVEGTLDALESELERKVEPGQKADEASVTAVSPARKPTFRRRLQHVPDGRPTRPKGRAAHEPHAGRARPSAIGGIGLGVALEPLPAPLALGAGPRLDVALGAGQVAAFASEALRLGVGAETDAQLIDAQGGVAWGAPFAWGAHWGALVSVGLQWLTLPAREQTVRTPTVGLGLRSGVDVGPAKLWLGLDGVIRTSPQRSEIPAPIALDPFSLAFLVGGFWLAD